MPQFPYLRKNKVIFTKTKGNWKRTFRQGGVFLRIPREQCMNEKKNDAGGCEESNSFWVLKNTYLHTIALWLSLLIKEGYLTKLSSLGCLPTRNNRWQRQRTSVRQNRRSLVVYTKTLPRQYMLEINCFMNETLIASILFIINTHNYRMSPHATYQYASFRRTLLPQHISKILQIDY